LGGDGRGPGFGLERGRDFGLFLSDFGQALGDSSRGRIDFGLALRDGGGSRVEFGFFLFPLSSPPL
jgi:hypothetical protein